MVIEITQFLLLVGMVVLFWMFLSLRKYINRKAENLAQKEDLESLTDIVERVRAQFGKASLIHRVQFEAEFRCYQDLWKSANEVHKTFVILNSLLITNSRSQVNFDKFTTAQLAYADVMEGSRPFVPDAVWKAFRGFEDLMIRDKTHGLFNVIAKESLDSYRKESRLSLEQCGEEIRKRLADLLIV